MTSKIALVTGGNKGIGFAICKGLLAKGFEVILAARSLDKAQATVEQLASLGTVTSVQLDATNERSIYLAAKTVSQTSDHLDVLVNNAGIYPDAGVNILTVPRDLLNLTMNTNAFGPIQITQEFLPLLEKAALKPQGTARVINVSSGAGEINSLSTQVPSYALSKLALNGATIMLAEALRSKNIAVYAMCPDWVRTEMGGAAAPRSPEQGADTAIWLATEASMNLSGKYFRDRKEISYSG